MLSGAHMRLKTIERTGARGGRVGSALKHNLPQPGRAGAADDDGDNDGDGDGDVADIDETGPDPGLLSL